MERHDDADAEHADDQAVKPRIGKECSEDLCLQHVGYQAAKHHEHQHPEEKDAGRWEFCLIDIGCCHRFALGPRIKTNMPQVGHY